MQTVYQPEILSSCGSSTCEDFQCTFVGFVLEKNQKLLWSAKTFWTNAFFFRFACLFFTEGKPYDNHLITFVFLVRFFLIKNLRFLASFTVLAQKCGPRTRPSLVMYKVAHIILRELRSPKSIRESLNQYQR